MISKSSPVNDGTGQGRPFNARGSRVIRCEICLMPVKACICAMKSPVESPVTFWLLMHRKEQYKPTNTGRLIEDSILGSKRSIWDRTNPPSDLVEAIEASEKEYLLLYPSDPETDINPESVDITQSEKEVCIIILDGTWRQTSRMINRSPYLESLPRVGIWDAASSDYQLRKSQHEYQLCTAEVAIKVLEGFKLDVPSASLKQYYDAFNQNYISARRGPGK